MHEPTLCPVSSSGLNVGVALLSSAALYYFQLFTASNL